MEPDSLYRAKWVFPIVGEPLENGAVVVHNGRITQVAPFTKDLAAGLPILDAGDVALFPALINAHTHLDLSEILQPLGAPGTPLHEWIPSVMASRANSPSSNSPTSSSLTTNTPLSNIPTTNHPSSNTQISDETPHLREGRGVAMGIEELTTTGTAALADFTQSESDAQSLETSSLGGWSLREFIGPTCARIDSVLQLATDFLTPKREPSFQRKGIISNVTDDSTNRYADIHLPRLRRGLAPHATYTVPLPLLERIVALAIRHQALVATHIAESPEETRFLNSQTGPLRHMLEQIGVLNFDAFPYHTTCYDYLTILAHAKRSLVVHGNFLDDDSMAFLSQHHDRMAVVHCPRSFRHFGYDVPIVQKLCQFGVRVILGTDGRSSTPSLDLMAEIVELLRVNPEIPFTKAVQMATLDAAQSLGIDAWYGSLLPNRIAKFVAFPIQGQSIAIPSTGIIVPFR